jgi:hypothetical protein
MKTLYMALAIHEEMTIHQIIARHHVCALCRLANECYYQNYLPLHHTSGSIQEILTH